MAGSMQTIDEAYRTYQATFANGYDPKTLIDEDWEAVMQTLDDYRNVLTRKMGRMAQPVDHDAPVMVLIMDVNHLQAKLINARKGHEEAVLADVHDGKQVTLLDPQCTLVAKTAPEAEVGEPDS